MNGEDEHEVTSLLTPQFSLLVAAVMLFCAWHFGGHMAELKFNGAAAEGQVVGIDSPKDPDTGLSDTRGPFYAVIAFKDETGEERKFMDRRGSTRRNKYAEGDRVQVLYRRENPEATAVVDRGAEMWTVPGVFAGFGLLFFLSALSRLQGGNRAV